MTPLSCSYLDINKVRALAIDATLVRLRGSGASSGVTEVTSANAVTALRDGLNWDSAPASWSGGWDWTTPTPPQLFASAWPNMYHARGNHGGVHWLVVDAYRHSPTHDNGIEPGPSYSSTWLLQKGVPQSVCLSLKCRACVATPGCGFCFTNRLCSATPCSSSVMPQWGWNAIDCITPTLAATSTDSTSVTQDIASFSASVTVYVSVSNSLTTSRTVSSSLSRSESVSPRLCSTTYSLAVSPSANSSRSISDRATDTLASSMTFSWSSSINRSTSKSASATSASGSRTSTATHSVELRLKRLLSLGEEVARDTVIVASIASMVSINPIVAGTVARMGAVQSVSACEFNSLDGEIGFFGGSFTGLVIGTDSGKYLLGGIVGNGIIVLCGTAFLMLLILIRMRSEAKLENNCGKSVSALLLHSLGVGRVPSIYFPVYLVFGSVMGGFALMLLSSPPTGANTSTAVVTLLAIIIYPTMVTINLKRNFNCSLVEVDFPTFPQRMGWVLWLCHPSTRWEVGDADSGNWKRRNRMCFDDFKIWWFGLLDLWSTPIIAVVNGIRVGSKEVCVAQLVVMFVLFSVLLGCGLWFNPCCTRSQRVYVNAMNAAGLMCSSLLIASIRVDSFAMFELSNWVMFIANLVSMFKLLLDLLYVSYRFLRPVHFAHKPVEDKEMIVVSLVPPQLITASSGGGDEQLSAPLSPAPLLPKVQLQEGDGDCPHQLPLHPSSAPRAINEDDRHHRQGT